MDVNSNRQSQSSGENEDLEDEPDEPDSSRKDTNRDHKVKGRFLIEEIEEQNEEGRCDLINCEIKNNDFSFKINKINFFHREIEIDEKYKFDITNLDNLNVFIYDNNSQNFQNFNQIFNSPKINLLQQDEIFVKFKYKDLFITDDKNFEININNKVNNFPYDIPDNDYAMILHEETLENENDILNKIENDVHQNILCTLDDLEENKLYCDLKYYPIANYNPIKIKKKSVAEKRFCSFDANFKENFISPSCSPINSPRNSNFKILYNTNPYLKKRKERKEIKFKLIKNSIKTIEDSFNLEEKDSNKLYKTSTGSNFREKRLLSFDIKIENLKNIKFDIDEKDEEIVKQEIEIEKVIQNKEELYLVNNPNLHENKKVDKTFSKNGFQIISSAAENNILFEAKKMYFNNLSIQHIETIIINKNTKNKSTSNIFNDSQPICKNCVLKGKTNIVFMVNKNK